jgi:pimeloyl-ACP methyl ester carboxylesterase
MRDMTMPNRVIQLADGRTLAIDERGSPDAPAVVLLHPAPGSRRFDPDPATTAAADIRLLTIDRHGYGGSTPLPDGAVPTVVGHADDVAMALDQLGVAQAGIIGWSAGGRVALALAARRPDLVRAVAVVGTPAPDEEVPWIVDEYRAMIGPLRADPGSATARIAPVFAGLAADPASAVASVGGGPADRVVIARDAGARGRLETMMVEAFRQGGVGLAADIVSYTVVPWGFDAATVGVRTTLVYGGADAIAGPPHGEWYAARIPRAKLEMVPESGHLVALNAWASIIAAVA